MLLMSACVPPVKAMYRAVVLLVVGNNDAPGMTLKAVRPSHLLAELRGPTPATRFLGAAKAWAAIIRVKRVNVASLRVVFRLDALYPPTSTLRTESAFDTEILLIH